MGRKPPGWILCCCLLLLLSILAQVFGQQCDVPCRCPRATPSCPAGVSLVLDGCGCCLMCARQEGEPCSHRSVCDSQHGLQCDYSASYPGGPGDCVSQNALGCQVNGARYDEGQSFQPTCSQLCHCLGGGITCVPTCSDELQPPALGCANPQLVRLPGRCCREWVCDSSLDNSILQDPPTALERSERSGQEVGQNQGVWSNCVEQSTEWSPCSCSCGPGVSIRLSNRNRACRPQTQTRLCQVTPCLAAVMVPPDRVQLLPEFRGSSVCKTSYRVPRPVFLEHQGCISSMAYRPRFCGQCWDGRCCSPYRSRTELMSFRCPQGRVTHHRVMMIESCVCHYNCAHPGWTAFRKPLSWH